MKEILPNIFAVEIPDDTVHAEIYDKESLPLAIMCYRKDPKGMFKPGIPEPVYPLTPGTYTLLFCSKDVTEEEGREILAKYGLSCHIHSILKSHSLLSNNYAIISNRA